MKLAYADLHESLVSSFRNRISITLLSEQKSSDGQNQFDDPI